MAIYYINPHTTTNGTGTFASPWSINVSTRSGLSAGDEIRILGVSLTNLLTATTYTVGLTNNYQITVTAGGGLGADFVAGNIVYFPTTDCFARVTSVAGNVISFGATNAVGVPWYDTTAGQTTTIRKVDTTTYGASLNQSSGLIVGDFTNINNITVSDCWVDATTRVTDGTVKTLIYTSLTTFMTIYAESSSVSTVAYSQNRVYNLENTHFIGSVSTTNTTTLNIACSNVTATVNQIWSGASSGAYLTMSRSGCINNTYTFKNLNNIFFNVWTLKNSTLTINNITLPSSSLFAISNNSTLENVTLNIGDFIFYSATPFIGTSNFVKGIIYNQNGIADQYSNVTPNGVFGAMGNYQVNFDPNFVYYRNRRASTGITISYLFYAVWNTSTIFHNMYVPYLPNIPTITTTNATTLLSAPGAAPITSAMEAVREYSLPSPSLPLNSTSTVAFGPNILVRYRDGSEPVEYLTYMITQSPGGVTLTILTVPKLERDFSVYRTVGPSLKTFLNTRTTSVWLPKQRVTKYIKIPVISGQTYTVDGYIQTDMSSYLTGDCSVSIWMNNTQYDTQDITTSCINSWENFNLSFTAPYTGEATIYWSMYFAEGAKSIWMDDLTIS